MPMNPPPTTTALFALWASIHDFTCSRQSSRHAHRVQLSNSYMSSRIDWKKSLSQLLEGERGSCSRHLLGVGNGADGEEPREVDAWNGGLNGARAGGQDELVVLLGGLSSGRGILHVSQSQCHVTLLCQCGGYSTTHHFIVSCNPSLLGGVPMPSSNCSKESLSSLSSLSLSLSLSPPRRLIRLRRGILAKTRYVKTACLS